MARLNKSAIRYLALEGGGGKGFAYLGALEKLKDLGVYSVAGGRLVGLNGVAGTSAGAITAMFLASGLGPDQIREKLGKTVFSEMFDMPDPGRRPGVKGVQQVTSIPTLSENPHTPRPGQPKPRESDGPSAEEIAMFVELLALLHPATRTLVMTKGAAVGLVDLLGRLSSEALDPPLKQILSDIPKTIGCLRTGFGVFVGDQFLNYFDKVLMESADGIASAKTGKKPSGPQKEKPYMSFARHKEVFQTTLAVMGTNLETMRSVLFSWKTTPKMPVAAAVRISMGLPLLFKPIILRDDGSKEIFSAADRKPPPPALGFEDLVGVWVDGGLLNNIPLQVFDDDMTPSRQFRRGAPGEQRVSKHQTLGLRLDIGDDQRKPIRSLGEFVQAWPIRLSMGGAGEAHINRSLSTLDRTILLDTTGLSTLNFQEPPKPIADEILRKSRQAVEDYFKGK